MLQQLVDMLGDRSLTGGCVFVFSTLVLCGFGLPLPEDIILVTGGVVAWLASPLDTPTIGGMLRDRGLLTMAGAGLVGIVVGDSIIYWAGCRFGRRIADVWPFRRIVTPAKLERVERLLRRRGNLVVVVARYLPGLRAPTYFTVGHARLPFWQFALFDTVAALISAPLWVSLGFWFGDDIERATREAARFSHFILLAVVLVLAFLAFRWRRRHSREAGATTGREPPEERQGGSQNRL